MSRGHPARAGRNYAKETAYENRPDQVRRRMARNRARAEMEKKGLVHKGDGKEVDHIRFTRTSSGKLTNKGNLRVISQSANRRKQPAHKGRNFN